MAQELGVPMGTEWSHEMMKNIRHYDLYVTNEEAEEARRREVEKGTMTEGEMQSLLETGPAMAYLAADGQVALWEVGGRERINPISLIPWEERMVAIKTVKFREDHGYDLFPGQ